MASKRPTLKLVTENDLDREPEEEATTQTRDPRALSRPDWFALILVILALVLAPLLTGSFSTLSAPELEFVSNPLANMKLLGLPLLFLLTGAALGIVLWREWKRPVAIGLVPGLAAGFGLLGIWAAVTLAHTRALYLSLNALSALIAALLLGALISRLGREKRAIQILLLAVAFAGTLEACVGIYEYFWAFNRHDMLHRVFGTFIGPNFLGGYLMLTLPLTMALFVAARELRLKLILGLGLFLQSACLLFTGSRAAVAILMVGLLGWLAMTALSGAGKGYWRQIAVALGLFAAGAVLASAPLRSRVEAPSGGAPAANSATAQATAEDQSHSGEFRRWTWIGTMRMATANPLLGTGLGSFDVAYAQYAETAYTAHAHNSYLQWMGETGIAGMLCLMIGLAAATAFAVNILLLRRRTPEDDEETVETVWEMKARAASLFGEPRLILTGLLAALLASLLHSFSDSDWYIVANLATLSAVVALIVATARDIAPLATQIPRPLGRPFFAIGVFLALLLLWRGVSAEGAQLAYASGNAEFEHWASSHESEVQQQARASFASAAAAMPFDPEPHLKLAELAADPDSALQELKTAVRLVASGKTYYRLGQFYRMQKQPEMAAEALERAHELDPHNTQTLRALGNAYLDANKTDQGVKTFQTLTALEERPYGRVRAVPQVVDTDFAFAHAALAHIAAQAGHDADAVAEFIKADKVLAEYWAGRHWDINLGSFPPAKRQEIATLYDEIYSEWQTSLSRQGKAQDAATIGVRQAQFRKERDEDKALQETTTEGASGA